MGIKIILKLKNAPEEAVIKDGKIAEDILEFSEECPKSLAARQVVDYKREMMEKYLDFEIIDEDEEG